MCVHACVRVRAPVCACVCVCEKQNLNLNNVQQFWNPTDINSSLLNACNLTWKSVGLLWKIWWFFTYPRGRCRESYLSKIASIVENKNIIWWAHTQHTEKIHPYWTHSITCIAPLVGILHSMTFDGVTVLVWAVEADLCIWFKISRLKDMSDAIGPL